MVATETRSPGSLPQVPQSPLGQAYRKVMSRTRCEGDCVVFTGFRNPKGYGSVHARVGNRKKSLMAHRVIWEYHHGPIAKSVCVLHRCDNPGCVTLGHLWLGTKADNNQDMVAKGHQVRGERHGSAKLTDLQVIGIRSRGAQGERRCDLSRAYGVSWTQINDILSGKNWRHL